MSAFPLAYNTCLCDLQLIKLHLYLNVYVDAQLRKMQPAIITFSQSNILGLHTSPALNPEASEVV